MAPSVIFSDLHGQGLSITDALKTQSKVPAKFENIANWPKHVHSDLAWNGANLTSSQYTYTLSKQDINEIAQGLVHFKGLGLFGSRISPETFPLPNLGRELRKIALSVHQGLGFHRIQGLEPADYSLEDNVLVLMGITSYIGQQVGIQHQDGDILTHIMNSNMSDTQEPQELRPLMYSKQQGTFHNDHNCDLLILQTQRNAAIGGDQLLASSAWIYNQLAATRPYILDELAKPDWPVLDLFNGDTESQRSKRPILFYHMGRVIFNFVRRALTGEDGQLKLEGLPDLSKEKLEALNTVQALAEQAQVVLPSVPGSINIINNYGVLHSRTGFQNDEDNARYVVRLWRRNRELTWELPQQLRKGAKFVYEYEQGREKWNILPVPKMKFDVYERTGY